MAILLDTNVLARIANKDDRDHAIAVRCVINLHNQGETLVLAPQNLVELRNVATRPIINNGLGLSASEADFLISKFESEFMLLIETQAIHTAWKLIISRAGTIGKQVHDARLAAIAEVNGVESILTFNTSHFEQFVRTGSVLRLLNPRDIQSDMPTY